MNINQTREGKFLKKEDCGKGILVTIKDSDYVNVAKAGEPEQMKLVVRFEECKPLVTNQTNAQIIAVIAQSEETDDWPGTKVVLFHDPNISYAVKVTGGIRARAPKGQAPDPDDVPF